MGTINNFKNRFTLAILMTCLISMSPLSAKTPVKALNHKQLKSHKTHYLEKSYIRAIEEEKRKSRVQKFLEETNTSKQQALNSETIIEIHDIIDGQLFFKKTNNQFSAEKIAVDQIWEGGSHSGIQLSGEGIKLGIWEQGVIRSTHQEFEDRVTIKDSDVETSIHATHVGGTMAGKGASGFERARGMAYNATIDSYEWSNPLSKMMKATNEENVYAANHSWGYAAGWEYSEELLAWVWFGDEAEEQDKKFGRYNSITQSWDELAHSFVYLNIVNAAGNDRGVYGSGSSGSHYHYNPVTGTKFIASGSETITHQRDDAESGYDTLTTIAVAKNIITVGAVNSSSEIASFTSWGPADDGRIKPDIVANGVNVYSSHSNSDTSYSFSSGTSMASPSITGGIGLLLEHQKNLYENTKKLLSSTIKALIINTAVEAGPNTGPDYMFGWGVANFEDAAVLMSENKIEDADYIIELLIENEQSQQFDITSDGLNPIKITLTWLDPPGPVQPDEIDPTLSVLVNDMDIRIKDADDKYYKPWKLDLTNPEAAAIATDNTIDNVEQILIPNPEAGTYTVFIGHKNKLSGFRDQPVSIVMDSTISNLKNYSANNFGNIARLEQGESGGDEEEIDEEASKIEAAKVIEFRNGPNPFNPTIESTKLYFQMNEDAIARIYIYSLNGEQVMLKEVEVTQGENVLEWDGKNKNGNTVANGVYIAYIYAENESGAHKAKRKIAVLK